MRQTHMLTSISFSCSSFIMQSSSAHPYTAAMMITKPQLKYSWFCSNPGQIPLK